MLDMSPSEQNLRACLSRFPSGVTVVSYQSVDGPRGITVNAFTSVSLDPPVILVALARRSRSHDLMARLPFTVNVLRTRQEDIARYCASSPDDYSWLPWTIGASPPRLEGALAHLICHPWRTIRAGDHTLYLGRVETLDYEDGDALGFFCSRFVPVPWPIPSQPPLPYDLFEQPADRP